ncbi:MAG: J domain-containing protein [Sulfurimonadaceae bacterium]|jgi:preprotein translocase subunit Sec63|nr:J domain-containing protein [Sulfurimonadaceae bacterium]
MHSFEQLMKAKTLLGLHDKATLPEIKIRYKNLMKKWHPDKHADNVDEANQMSMKINEAYEIVMHYVGNYEYRFDEEFLKDTTISPQEWWEKRFGGR